MKESVTNRKLKILDCTIRDGGYVNSWRFEKKLVRESYRAVSKSGVDFFEIGYKGTERHFDVEKHGIWRFCNEEDIREATENINGAKIAVMADFGRIEAEDFIDAKESRIELVRIAVHKDKLKDASVLIQGVKKKGYAVSLNAMGYSEYTDLERNEFMEHIKDLNLDYVYVADSYGSLFPSEIRPLLEPLLELPGIKVGFHPHNNLQMAFANALEAINCGVHIIDSTVYGMGRAAGNLPTETFIAFMEKENAKYNSIPVLNLIDKYYHQLYEENRWGYQLSYMLSGIFHCHPDYAKSLVDLREYTIEDIWKAMDYVKRKKPIGFSKAILNGVINEGIIGGSTKVREKGAQETGTCSTPEQAADFEVTYQDRHKGQDFLVLANGPSLKTHSADIHRFIDAHAPIILGANYLGNLFKPHYHAFNNKRRFIDYIDTVDRESKLLIGQYISDEMIREYTGREYEKIYYQDRLDSDFGIINGVITVNCRTIAILLLGVAIAMGARRVFCAGMDGYVDIEKYHFYQESDEKGNIDMIIERHRWNQRFLEQIDRYLSSKGEEGIHILTPTSYRGFYKGIANFI